MLILWRPLSTAEDETGRVKMITDISLQSMALIMLCYMQRMTIFLANYKMHVLYMYSSENN